jgi:hypothetical protein
MLFPVSVTLSRLFRATDEAAGGVAVEAEAPATETANPLANRTVPEWKEGRMARAATATKKTKKPATKKSAAKKAKAKTAAAEKPVEKPAAKSENKSELCSPSQR